MLSIKDMEAFVIDELDAISGFVRAAWGGEASLSSSALVRVLLKRDDFVKLISEHDFGNDQEVCISPYGNTIYFSDRIHICCLEDTKGIFFYLGGYDQRIDNLDKDAIVRLLMEAEE